MYCSKCGVKNDDNALFCGECGSPQSGPGKSQKEEIQPELQAQTLSESSGSLQSQNQPVAPMKRKRKGLPIRLLAAVVVVAVVTVGVFVYLNTGARLADKQAVQGEKYLAGKQYDEAIGSFEKAIKTDKKTAKAYTGLADAYVELNDSKKAEESVQSGIEASPGADILYLKLAELYANDGKPRKAVQILKTGYAAVKSQNIQTQLKKLQAAFINIAGGERVEFGVTFNAGDSQEVIIGILKDRAVQLGYKDAVVYSGGSYLGGGTLYGGGRFYVDIIGKELDGNQVHDLISIQRPVDKTTLIWKVIPPQYDENNLPDEINIMGGVRYVIMLENQTANIEEVIRSMRERAAQLGYDGTAIYQQEKPRVVIDLWGNSDFWSKIGDPDVAIKSLFKDQVNISIADKRQINRIH